MKKYLMIACEIIEDEINAGLKEIDFPYPILYLPPDLHMLPEKLQAYLQEQINRIKNVDYIILPMGRCGNGTLGLKSETATLILPKCEDCVNLLLSDENLSVQRPKFTMFFTDGWMRNENAASFEYQRTIDKYGKDQADSIMGMIYSGYKYFSLIETGAYEKQRVIDLLQPLADVVDVKINYLPGKYGVLKKMLNLNFDDNFAMFPPGTEVTAEALE
ncbi:MAG: DUF1638 domain-containing protein [Clostridiales bacterium]